MYHAIVERKVRSIWAAVGDGDLDAPWRAAADDLRFTFVGATGVGDEVVDRDTFRTWFHELHAMFATLRFSVRDVAVSGWPWHTRVAVRLEVDGEQLDGTPYTNDVVQWLTLKWGTMTDDWILEDTQRLQAALDRVGPDDAIRRLAE